ncbi:hypothetical protein CRG98_000257 [Punica granatum]|uniref:Uncharacterized protein n=1 Tax=Punica granatum TaxID=22663 RepID=A0A2I0LF50_PUNGR|nr:hypothetical protein CRG98_000257 [Punica granatum]
MHTHACLPVTLPTCLLFGPLALFRTEAATSDQFRSVLNPTLPHASSLAPASFFLFLCSAANGSLGPRHLCCPRLSSTIFTDTQRNPPVIPPSNSPSSRELTPTAHPQNNRRPPSPSDFRASSIHIHASSEPSSTISGSLLEPRSTLASFEKLSEPPGPVSSPPRRCSFQSGLSRPDRVPDSPNRPDFHNPPDLVACIGPHLDGDNVK